jgi:hypothetical protein
MTITIKGRVKIDERFSFLTQMLVYEYLVYKAQHDFGHACCPTSPRCYLLGRFW